MLPSIQIEPKRAYDARYRDYVKEEWSEPLLPKLLDFLERQLQAVGGRLVFPWDAKQNGKGSRKVLSSDLTALLEVLQRAQRHLLPRVPAQWPTTTRAEGITRLANRASALLLVQLLFEVEGEVGLFQDTQSLLFINSTYFLLPRLADAGCDVEHDLLINAMAVHATLVWTEDPPQQQFLMAVLANYLHDDATEERALRASLSLTSPEDHVYLTKVQCLWQFLLDHDRAHDATTLLLNVYRTAPREHLPELQEMLTETYSHGHA